MNRIWFLPLLSMFVSFSYANERDSVFHRLYELDEIIIRPVKQVKVSKELPLSVSQLSATAIINQQLMNTKDISAIIPNLYIPDYGSKYTTPVFIRGVGSKNGTPSVGLYVDGIPYFEKSAFDFDLSEVEQIEVFRGPQGTLYGRNTMGGLIHVSTRSPLRHEFTSFRVDGGSHGRFQGTFSHYRKIKENVGYSLTGKYQRSSGYFTNTCTGEKADDGQAGNVRARLEWMINPRLMLGVTSLYDRSVQGANAYALVDPDSKVLGEISFDSPSYYHRTLSASGVSLKYMKPNFELSYQQSLQYTKDKLRQDQDFTPVKRVNSLISQKQLMTSGELNIKVRVNEHYQGITGMFGFYQQVDKDVATLYAAYTAHKNDDIPTHGIALYHQSIIDHVGIDCLSLIFGLRYDYERANRDYSYHKDDESPAGYEARMNFSQWVPKVALQYRIGSDGQLYTSVSKGYKTGGFNTSFFTDKENAYDPESSWDYEVGMKHSFWERRLYAELAFYWINWKNQQVQQKVDTGGFMIRNAGRSVSKGIECCLQYNPFNGMNIQLNYGYTHATFKRYQYTEKTDYSGHFLPMVPRHTLGGSINYTRSVRHRFFDRYQLGMNVSGNGKIYWHESNRETQSFYAVLSATASVTKGKITLGIWSKNLTNTDYVSYLFKASSGMFAQRGRPFALGGSCSITI